MKTAVYVSLGEKDQQWYEIDSQKVLNELDKEGEYREANYPDPCGKDENVSYERRKMGDDTIGFTFFYKSSETVNNYSGYYIVSALSAEDIQKNYAVDYIRSKFVLNGRLTEDQIIGAVSKGWLKKTKIDVDAVFAAYKTIIPCIVDKLLNILKGEKCTIGIAADGLTAAQDVLICAVKCLPVCIANQVSYSSYGSKDDGVNVFCAQEAGEAATDVVYFDIADQDEWKGYSFKNRYAELLSERESVSDFLVKSGLGEMKTVEELNSYVNLCLLKEAVEGKNCDDFIKNKVYFTQVYDKYESCKILADGDGDIINKFTQIAYAIFFSERYFAADAKVKDFFKGWLKPDRKISIQLRSAAADLPKVFGSPNFSSEYINFLFSCADGGTDNAVYPEVKREIEAFIDQKIYTSDIVKNLSDEDIKDIATHIATVRLKGLPVNTVAFIYDNFNIIDKKILNNFKVIISAQSNEWIETFVSAYVSKRDAAGDAEINDFFSQCLKSLAVDRKVELLKIVKEQVRKWLEANGFIDAEVLKKSAEKRVEGTGDYIDAVINNLPMKSLERWRSKCKNCISNRNTAYKVLTFIAMLAASLLVSHFFIFTPLFNMFLGDNASYNVIWMVDIFYIVLYFSWGFSTFAAYAKVKLKFVMQLAVVIIVALAVIVAVFGIAIVIPGLF